MTKLVGPGVAPLTSRERATLLAIMAGGALLIAAAMITGIYTQVRRTYALYPVPAQSQDTTCCTCCERVEP